MRILFHVYIPYTPRQAGIQQPIRVCYYLAKRGLNVSLHICSWSISNRTQLLDFFGFEDLDNFEIHCYKNPFKIHQSPILLSVWGAVFYLRRFFSLLLTSEKKKYDVFFARGYRFPALHIFFKSFLKYKIVFEIHQVLYLDNTPEDKINDVTKRIDYERFSYRNADGVIAISESLKSFVEDRWGRVSRVTVIPSGGILFRSKPLPQVSVLKDIYYVGNYYPLSGLDYLVKALDQIPEAQLTIVGGGGPGDPDYERIDDLVGQLNLKERVTQMGFVKPTELPEIYARAHILAMPYATSIRTRYFMSPLKLFEYMSARRPIVASDLPPIREILRNGENAILTRVGDPDSIAEALRTIMGNPELGLRLAGRAYQDVQQYSMDKKCIAIEKFLHEII